MSEEEGFREALGADPEDDVTRLVYADWLDEHDRPEEARRMRRWRASWEWMKDLARRGGVTQDEDDLWRAIIARDVVDAGTTYAAGDGLWRDFFVQQGSEQLRDLFGVFGERADGSVYYDEEASAELARKYWDHWEVVTGGLRPRPQEHHPEPPAPFSCSC